MPGSGMRSDESALHHNTIDDCAYIPRIRCPILYLSPTNDFAGPLDNMAENWRQIGSKDVHYADFAALQPSTLRRVQRPASTSCFEHYLKGGAPLPGTPVLTVKLDSPDGVPMATVTPDRAAEVTRVSIYYSVDPHVLTRFWRDAQAKREGEAWVARCPIMSAEEPLYVIASVYYPLKQNFHPLPVDRLRPHQGVRGQFDLDRAVPCRSEEGRDQSNGPRRGVNRRLFAAVA